jgi:hypothetical protein
MHRLNSDHFAVEDSLDYIVEKDEGRFTKKNERPVRAVCGGRHYEDDCDEAKVTSRQYRDERRGQKLTKNRARSVKSAKQGPEVSDLEKALSLIRTHPGIRPSELNRLLNREQSDGLRNTLIKRGLVRKERDGSAMRYYPV